MADVTLHLFFLNTVSCHMRLFRVCAMLTSARFATLTLPPFCSPKHDVSLHVSRLFFEPCFLSLQTVYQGVDMTQTQFIECVDDV